MVKCVGTAANVMNKYEVLGVVGEGENFDEIMDTIISCKTVSQIVQIVTNTPSDEYDSYREYRVANTNMYSRIQ